MGAVFAKQIPEEPIIHEARPDELETEVRYPDGFVDKKIIQLSDDVRVEMVKQSLLNERDIIDFENYSLIAVYSNNEFILPDNEVMLAHLDVLVTGGDDSYLEIRSR